MDDVAVRITVGIVAVYVVCVLWTFFRSTVRLIGQLQGLAPIDPLTIISLAVGVLMTVNLFVLVRHSDLVKSDRARRKAEKDDAGR